MNPLNKNKKELDVILGELENYRNDVQDDYELKKNNAKKESERILRHNLSR